jgi:hypothetical protein
MRLLSRNEWFDPLSQAGSLSELEFEKLVFQHAQQLFPNYVMVKYRLNVMAEEDTRRPDFALIHHEYRSWWVVEIELVHHSLQGHVVPQVACFSTGTYSVDLAEYFARQSPELKIEPLTEMIKGAAPGVLVVANGYSEEWERNLSPYGAKLAVVEVFRSERNRHIFQYRGAEIDGPADVLTTCRRDRSLPRLLIVDSPAALLAISDSRLTIYYEGAPSEWSRVSVSDRVWLNPVRQSPIDDSVQRVDIVKANDGRLSFRAASKGGRE